METSDPPNLGQARPLALGQAFAELGIEVGASGAEIRQAYLRLLKTRKPEIDPEGFRRLREAYDLVRATDGASVPGFFQANEPVPRTQSESPSSEDTPIGTPAANVASERPAQIGANGALETEARALTEAYRRALEWPDTTVPPVPLALDTMLRLHEVGTLDVPFWLGRALNDWVERTEGHARHLGGAAAIVWSVLGDLAMLPDVVPLEIRAAIARATREGDLLLARHELMAYRERSRVDAEKLNGLLFARAPTIAASLGTYLIWAPKPPRFAKPTILTLFLLVMGIRGLLPIVWHDPPTLPEGHERDNRAEIDAKLRQLSQAVLSNQCDEIQRCAEDVSAAMHRDGARPDENQRALLGQLLKKSKVACGDARSEEGTR